ncbi:MAG: hypothetical protein WBD98_00920, partial [Acidobacteriaceae bacterium]
VMAGVFGIQARLKLEGSFDFEGRVDHDEECGEIGLLGKSDFHRSVLSRGVLITNEEAGSL